MFFLSATTDTTTAWAAVVYTFCAIVTIIGAFYNWRTSRKVKNLTHVVESLNQIVHPLRESANLQERLAKKSLMPIFSGLTVSQTTTHAHYDVFFVILRNDGQHAQSVTANSISDQKLTIRRGDFAPVIGDISIQIFSPELAKKYRELIFDFLLNFKDGSGKEYQQKISVDKCIIQVTEPIAC